MKTRIQELFSKYQPSYSGAVLIKQGDEVILSYAGGLAHKGFRVLNTPHTRFDCASVTKVFTAAVILKLCETGRLSLDDRITEILDLSGTRISNQIKIEHLLTHTSGIADDADEEAGEDYAALFVDKPNYSFRQGRDFLPQFVYKQPFFEPGAGVRYNNCAFILLGLAVERITGLGYREYVSSNIFEPGGMTGSGFVAMDEPSDVAEGYIQDTDEKGGPVKWRKNIYSYPPIGTAEGGAYTTVGDLDRFLRAIRNNTLLAPEYSQALRRPQSAFVRPHRWGGWRTGYAFEFIEDTEKRVLCMYKDGFNCGVEAMCAWYPRAGLTVNLLSNQNNCVFPLHRELQDLIIPEYSG